METGFVAICKGEYEISTGVEEIRTGGGGGEIGDLIAEGEKNSGKLGPDGIPEDLVEMAIGKRSWVSRELCVLLVRDGGV